MKKNKTMKIITLFLLTIFISSCGYNKEEQLLYNYLQKKAKSKNFDLKDLDFDIKEIKKIGDITTKDGIKSKKYKAIYSFKNPMLGNTKQTFERVFYTGNTPIEFIKSEKIKEIVE